MTKPTGRPPGRPKKEPDQEKAPTGLNGRQARFVREYLIDLNALQAAIRAGYSVATAGQIGSKLLKNVEVQAAVARGQASIAKRTNLTQTMVVEGLLKEARNEGKGGSASARVSAWGLLAKHLGMLVERLKVDPDSAPLVQVYLPSNNR